MKSQSKVAAERESIDLSSLEIQQKIEKAEKGVQHVAVLASFEQLEPLQIAPSYQPIIAVPLNELATENQVLQLCAPASQTIRLQAKLTAEKAYEIEQLPDANYKTNNDFTTPLAAVKKANRDRIDELRYASRRTRTQSHSDNTGGNRGLISSE